MSGGVLLGGVNWSVGFETDDPNVSPAVVAALPDTAFMSASGGIMSYRNVPNIVVIEFAWLDAIVYYVDGRGVSRLAAARAIITLSCMLRRNGRSCSRSRTAGVLSLWILGWEQFGKARHCSMPPAMKCCSDHPSERSTMKLEVPDCYPSVILSWGRK